MSKEQQDHSNMFLFQRSIRHLTWRTTYV